MALKSTIFIWVFSLLSLPYPQFFTLAAVFDSMDFLASKPNIYALPATHYCFQQLGVTEKTGIDTLKKV